MPPLIEESKCVKCHRCVNICTLDVFGAQERSKEHAPVVQYPDECWHCRACELECPTGAVSLRYPLPYIIAAKAPIQNQNQTAN